MLPAVLLGHAIDALLALEQGRGSSAGVTRATGLFLAGTVAFEATKMMKRWWLNTAWAAMKANIRADALRGVLAWPFDRMAQTPEGEVLARVIGDVEVLGDGVGEVVFETWDTVLLTLSLAVAMLLYDWRLAALVLLPVPFALVVGAAAGRAVAPRRSSSCWAVSTHRGLVRCASTAPTLEAFRMTSARWSRGSFQGAPLLSAAVRVNVTLGDGSIGTDEVERALEVVGLSDLSSGASLPASTRS